MNELVLTIKKQTEVMFTNADIMLKTCDLNLVLCDMPIWKHIYHALHSLDRWFINPYEYSEPDFHEENLNSLDIPSDKELSYEQLEGYLEEIKNKTINYVDSLTDEMLYEIPTDARSIDLD